MDRRRVLTAVGFGAVTLSGCLSSDDDDATPSSDDGRPSADVPADATAGDCPETDAEPPVERSTQAIESFVEEFEADYVAASASANASRSGSAEVETIIVEDDVARVDASVWFVGSGWDGDMTLRPLEDGESLADEDELERVSTATGPIPETESLLEAIEDAVDTGDPQTVDDADSLGALSAAGEYREDFLLEHGDDVLRVENDAVVWESHGEWFVGYLIADGAVYRTQHDPENLRNRPANAPIEVPDGEWAHLECWS